MSNAVIGFPRWTEKITFSGGGWLAERPLVNLKNLPLAKIARSTNLNLSSTQFIATLDKSRAFRLIAFVRHNFSLDAQIRIRIFADEARTVELYDSGFFSVWTGVYTTAGLEWENDNWWSGQYTIEELTGYNWTRPIWLDKIYLGRALHIEIDDQFNSDGYVDLGLFELANGWQVGVNFQYGAEYGYSTRTTSEEADGGVEYFTRKDKPRIFNGNIGLLKRDEALSRGFELHRQNDIDTPFFWLPNPDDNNNILRNSFLARNRDLGLFSYTAFDRDSMPITLKEVL